MWVMSAVVEADERGRILIPAEMRNKFKSKRYRIVEKKNRLELEPLEDVEGLYRSFAKKIKSDWDSLEEKGEDFVSKGRRTRK
jgi:bifunctional DNA-binding transcriptional regulator/antitoxin component of YhaV-PrlF toxin-antitoxin module